MGERCSCTDALRDTGLRKFSLPFDWIGLEYADNDVSGGLFTKCRLLIQNCDDWLNFKDFEDLDRKGDNLGVGHRCVVNKKTGLRYKHDFPLTSSIKDYWPEFTEKYNRRIKRMYSKIEKAKRILLVYDKILKYDKISGKVSYTARHNIEPYVNTLLGILTELKRKYPRKNFSFLIFLHDESIAIDEYNEERPYPNITYVYLNNKGKVNHDGNKDVVMRYLKDNIALT